MVAQEEESSAEDAIELRREARRAITLSALTGLTVSVAAGGSILLWSSAAQSMALAAGGIVSILLVKQMDRHLLVYDEYRTVRGEKPSMMWDSEPVGTGRRYLRFQADRASWSPRMVIVGIWSCWVFPVGYFAFLVAYAVLAAASVVLHS